MKYSVLVGLAFLGGMIHAQGVRELVVAPGGETPQGALAKVRAAKAAGDKSAWTVRVKPGIYVLDEALTFTPVDSGEPQAPVSWVGEEGASVIAGGEPLTNWKDEGAGVWSAPLPKQKDGRPEFFEQLWVNGRRASRARLPDTGFIVMKKPTCAASPDGKPNSFIEKFVIDAALGNKLAQVSAAELPFAQACIVRKWTFARRILRGYEAAAIASARLVGRGDEKAADQAAVDAMRTQLNLLEIRGTIVIGEGERDEAPMLYIGEEVGLGNGPEVDIALDPLEGTTLTAKDMPNALTVISMAPRGTMLHAPDVYMEKLAIGPGYAEGVVTLDMSPEERVRQLAKAKGGKPEDITVCILERERHADLIKAVRSTGAAIRLITDGDVAGVMHCAEAEQTGIDMYMGSGGAPEGVLAASALKCMGGQIFGKLLFRNEDEKTRAGRAGITNLDRIYARDDMVTADVIFAATGVTDGSLLRGIKTEGGWITTETVLMRSKTGSVRRMTYRTQVK